MSDYYYMNSRGDVVDLCASPLWVASFNCLRSYAYERIEQNGFFFGHTRSKNVKKPLKFQYFNENRRAFCEYYENNVYRVINYDPIVNRNGRLYCGDFYAVGNFPEAIIETYDKYRGIWTAQIPFFMPEEVWQRELLSVTFEGNQTDPSSVPAVPLANYPSSYPHGYVSGNLEREIINDSAFPSKFRLAIYGACSNPTVTIGSHVYNVNVTVPAGSRLIIDSSEKSIMMYDAHIVGTNVFAYQNHDTDKNVFEPIPTGGFTVRYQNIPKITLTLYEERSAAKWI